MAVKQAAIKLAGEIQACYHHDYPTLKPVGEDVEIFIPSRSRFERSLTLDALTLGGLAERAVLVVPYAQGKDYVPLARKHKVKQILRCKEDGIARTRQFIGEHAENKFIMFDDDLRFYRRLRDGPRLYKFGPRDMNAMFILVSRLLDDFAHVAIGARGGNNSLPFPIIYNARPLRALAYRKREFMRCVHGRVAIMEDFDVTLQLMRQGYMNAVTTEYAQDQPETQTAGGCSDYRTKELHAKNVLKMAELHAGYVKVVEKKNKTGGEFGHRTEAEIHWEKAYYAALNEVI